MYRIIHKNYAHHHPATSVMTAGNWKVYNVNDVEEGWPGGGICLTLNVPSTHIKILEALGNADPEDNWELPVVKPGSRPASEEQSELSEEAIEESAREELSSPGESNDSSGGF